MGGPTAGAFLRDGVCFGCSSSDDCSGDEGGGACLGFLRGRREEAFARPAMRKGTWKEAELWASAENVGEVGWLTWGPFHCVHHGLQGHGPLILVPAGMLLEWLHAFLASCETQ